MLITEDHHMFKELMDSPLWPLFPFHLSQGVNCCHDFQILLITKEPDIFTKTGITIREGRSIPLQACLFKGSPEEIQCLMRIFQASEPLRAHMIHLAQRAVPCLLQSTMPIPPEALGKQHISQATR